MSPLFIKMTTPCFPMGRICPLEEAYLLEEIDYLGSQMTSQNDNTCHPFPNSILVLRRVKRTLYFQPTINFPANGRVKFGATSPYIPVHTYTYNQTYWVEP